MYGKKDENEKYISIHAEKKVFFKELKSKMMINRSFHPKNWNTNTHINIYPREFVLCFEIMLSLWKKVILWISFPDKIFVSGELVFLQTTQSKKIKWINKEQISLCFY